MLPNSTLHEARQVVVDLAEKTLDATQLGAIQQAILLFDQRERGADAPMALINASPPGCGKTEVIALMQLLAMTASPDCVSNVYALSTTRVAAEEIFSRVFSKYCRLLLGHGGVPPPDPQRVRTIHSFALHALSAKARASGQEVQVISKAEVLAMLSKLLGELREELIRTKCQIMRNDVIYLLDDNKACELLYSVRAEWLKYGNMQFDSIGPSSSKLLKRLQARMLTPESGPMLVDFDWIIYDLNRSGASIVGPNDVLFVDEAQDLSHAQVGIVMNSLRCGARVVIFGDDPQGIFIFSGAMHRTMEVLESRVRGMGLTFFKTKFTKNYRCTNEIIAVANRILSAEDQAQRQDMTGKGEGRAVRIRAECESEANAVVLQIVDLLRDGVHPEEIAVLCHRRIDLEPCSPLYQRLAEQTRPLSSDKNTGVPVAVLGLTQNHSITAKAVAILNVAIDSAASTGQDGEEARLEECANFMRAVRGTKVCSAPLVLKACERVLRTLDCSVSKLFCSHKVALLQAYRALLREEPEKKKKKKPEPAAKRQCHPGADVDAKVERLAKTVDTLAASYRAVRGAVAKAAGGERPRAVSVAQGQVPPERMAPTSEWPLGEAAWRTIAGIVKHQFEQTDPHKMTIEREEVTHFVRGLDVGCALPEDASVEQQIDAAGLAWRGALVELGARVESQNSEGRIVFATGHRFKGRQRRFVFCINMREPFATVDAARLAALGAFHDEGCDNLAGKHDCDCIGFKERVDDMRAGEIDQRLRTAHVMATRAIEGLWLTSQRTTVTGPHAMKPNHRPFEKLTNMAGGVTDEWIDVVR